MKYQKFNMKVLSAFLILLSASSCVAPATDQEITAMCENLVKLRREVNMDSLEKLTKDVNEQYAREEIRLKEWKERDLKGWDDELQTKLSSMTNEKEKSALTEEYKKKKEITAGQHDPGINELPGKLAEALEEAKRKAADNKAAFDAAVKACFDQSKREGVSQKSAQCRIKAETPDKYWNACR